MLGSGLVGQSKKHLITGYRYRTMRNETEEVRPLHDLYCKLTNREMPLSITMIFSWVQWKSHGWGEDELHLVVNHIKTMISKGRRYRESFRFNNLIMDTMRFQEDLSEARALSRIPKVDQGKASVLRGTFRPAEPSTPDAKPAGEILSRMEIAKRLKELRLNL